MICKERGSFIEPFSFYENGLLAGTRDGVCLGLPYHASIAKDLRNFKPFDTLPIL